MAFYRYHVFFCVNQRQQGEDCCANSGAQEMRDYAKKRVKELGLDGEGGIRINNAGCLDRCALGPTMVIYPGATWYTYVDNKDIDEIIEQHLQNDQIVPRLLL